VRVIITARLSNYELNATSIETQIAEQREYHRRKGNVVVAEAVDMDVSGDKPIRERAKIGELLKPEHLDNYDGISGYDIDRLFRNSYDFVTFYHDFVQPNKKILIATDEDIDSSTGRGQERILDRVVDAEKELRKIKERNHRKYWALLNAGYWPGGQLPFGYRAIKSGKHYVLVIHEEHAQIIREAAQDIINGRSLGNIAQDLTKRSIPTGRKQGPRDDKTARTNWSSTALGRLLRNPTLVGYIVINHKRDGWHEEYELLRDDDGVPKRREPILDDDTFARLQEALKRPARGAGKNAEPSPLQQIALCRQCDSVLYYNGFTSRGKRYAYYVCPNCRKPSFPATETERVVDDMMGTYGWVPHRVRKPRTSSVRSKRIHDVGKAITDLTADRYVRGMMPPDYDERLAKLQAEHERLLALPPEPHRPEWEETGKTIEQVWPEWDVARKRAFLIERGIKMYPERAPDGRVTAEFKGGEYWEMVCALGGYADAESAMEAFSGVKVGEPA
jgi:site-specific DNA recombinase